MARLGYLVLCLSFAPLTRAAEALPCWPLDAEARRRLDQAASLRKLENLAEEKINLVGSVPAWILTHLDLPSEEELRRSRSTHTQLVLGETCRLPPAIAQRVLERLVLHLPGYLRPPGFRYSLTLLEGPVTASTPGGGYLLLPRPLVELILRDRARGEAALAYLVAREIAHVGLGHCRRGWQRVILEEELRQGIHHAPQKWREHLETKVQTTGLALQFLFSRNQEYRADLFAYHLCRNAGYTPDSALDGMRLLATLASTPDGALLPGRFATLRYYLSTAADPLRRLKRLLMERDGEVEPADVFGLFVYDQTQDDLVRCRPGSLPAGSQPIVFVHGMHGGKRTFQAYLRQYANDPDLTGRPLLVFRHPGNSSLCRSAQLLHRLVRETLLEPGRTTFICHSAGGLVFRYYAERLGGGFDRAVILATPHAGSDLTRLKYFVDVVEFFGSLRFGVTEAIAHTIAEGRGEIGLDLHPDSLFFRHLGNGTAFAGRYHILYGNWMHPGQQLATRLSFDILRKQFQPHVARFLPEGTLRHQADRLVQRTQLPEEILNGDLVVSAQSARLGGAAKTTKLRLGHLAFRDDAKVIRLVKESILER